MFEIILPFPHEYMSFRCDLQLQGVRVSFKASWMLVIGDINCWLPNAIKMPHSTFNFVAMKLF